MSNFQNSKPKFFKLPIEENSRRKTCGFHIFPEFESLIQALAKRNPKIRHKGEALEYLVEFYLTYLPAQKREELLELMNGELEW